MYAYTTMAKQNYSGKRETESGGGICAFLVTTTHKHAVHAGAQECSSTSACKGKGVSQRTHRNVLVASRYWAHLGPHPCTNSLQGEGVHQPQTHAPQQVRHCPQPTRHHTISLIIISSSSTDNMMAVTTTHKALSPTNKALYPQSHHHHHQQQYRQHDGGDNDT